MPGSLGTIISSMTMRGVCAWTCVAASVATVARMSLAIMGVLPMVILSRLAMIDQIGPHVGGASAVTSPRGERECAPYRRHRDHGFPAWRPARALPTAALHKIRHSARGRHH